MNVPPWTVVSMPVVRSTPRLLSDIVPRLRVAGFTSTQQPGGLSFGSILHSSHDHHPISIAFDWAEVRHDVFALIDPMSILSNIELVSDDGFPLTQSMVSVHLNTAVYRLKWQAAVSAYLASTYAMPMAA